MFSLKPSYATSSGAKSLIAPSPYAIKMAVINSLFILFPEEEVKKHFEWLKKLEIKIKPPEKAVFNNCFIKILKMRESKASREKPDKNFFLIQEGNIFQETIAFREYVFFDGILEIAFDVSNINEANKNMLIDCLYKINYFGKKGCFFQLIEHQSDIENLDKDFNMPIKDILSLADVDGITMPMDDLGENAIFDAINIYSDKKLTIGKDRTQDIYIFPNYERQKSSKSFTYYSR